jgi:hypothetical protein
MPGTRPGMTNSKAAKGTVTNVISDTVSNSQNISNAPPHSRGANAPEVCMDASPFKNRGRRECRALDAPAASRANGEVSTRA